MWNGYSHSYNQLTIFEYIFVNTLMLINPKHNRHDTILMLIINFNW